AGGPLRCSAGMRGKPDRPRGYPRQAGPSGRSRACCGRLLVGAERATPRDMARLHDALAAAEAIGAALDQLGGLGIAGFAPAPELRQLLARALADTARPAAEASSLLAAGWD